jgi:prolyl 4-hydroxylase
VIAQAEKSLFADSVVGLNAQPSSVRTSMSARLDTQWPLLCHIRERLAVLLECDVKMIEDGFVTRYHKGQRFVPHHDSVPEYPALCRRTTALIYLNNLPDDETGGSTRFVRLNLSIRPKRGLAVIWDNHHARMTRDDRMEHAGEPLEKSASHKYVLQFFVKDV